MYQGREWRNQDAKARLQVERGVACVVVTGLITPGAAVGLRPWMALHLSEERVSSILMRAERAALVAAAPEVIGRLEDFAAGGVLRRPGALVVPYGCEDEFEAYAWALAQVGVVRAIFTDAPPAIAWCQKVAERRLRVRTMG